MHYALIVPDWKSFEFFHREDEKFSSGEHPTKEQVFGWCLEDLLQSREGQTSLPYEPWKFVSGESKEAIEAGKYELIEEFHVKDANGLWNLYNWVRDAQCVVFRLKLDY